MNVKLSIVAVTRTYTQNFSFQFLNQMWNGLGEKIKSINIFHKHYQKILKFEVVSL